MKHTKSNPYLLVPSQMVVEQSLNYQHEISTKISNNPILSLKFARKYTILDKTTNWSTLRNLVERNLIVNIPSHVRENIKKKPTFFFTVRHFWIWHS